ncbi:glycoside hydrolase family 15 protein [Sulfurimonas sp.]
MTQSLLDKHFHTIDKIILSRQDAISGLLPASTAVNTHGDYTDAWVRDNVYSILSVWGLSLSYKKYFPKDERTYTLSHSVIKLMRGVLIAMMRQSNKVEAFKKSLNPADALHAKYGTRTGLEVVGDYDWGHLQLDATSLFLLMLAQMSASGLHIIYTKDEVDFVQNLVYYISRTYCTPDYGIWERGNKINSGMTEINASSIGMAKAALEALDGFNLFVNIDSSKGIIHVTLSDIARSDVTLQGLLPRESNSKETDAALLSIIGYPAYAVSDLEIVNKTRKKILDKLAGNYGCKRFLLDGHQSSIEDASKLHYEPSELREFKDIESQWPLFFTYLLLDAIMQEDEENIIRWKDKLEALFVEEDGLKLLPELYLVPKELITAEKLNPNSQKRVPNENIPLVWAQSLFMLSDMILDGILESSDIDPLKRRQKLGISINAAPMVSIITENTQIKERLHQFGIISQSLEDLDSIKIMHACELSKINTLIGKNKKLSLTGRPLLEMRSITTSSLFSIDGIKTLFLPYYFNPEGFYLAYDNKLLIEQFFASLKFLNKNYNREARPIMLFYVRDDMLGENDKKFILEFLIRLHNAQDEGCSVDVGLLDDLLNQADIRYIENVDGLELQELLPTHLKSTNQTQYTQDTTETLSNIRALKSLDDLDNEALNELLYSNAHLLQKVHALKLLFKRNAKTSTLQDLAYTYYELAAKSHNWAVLRRIAKIININDSRVEDALLDIVIFQKSLAVGRAYSEEATFTKPHETSYIVDAIKRFSGESTAEGVLIQEITIHLGHLIRIDWKLFQTLTTIRPWYFVQLLVGRISREEKLSLSDAYELLICFEPNKIYKMLRTILQSLSSEVLLLNKLENLHLSNSLDIDTIKPMPLQQQYSEVHEWELWRKEVGMIGRFSKDFHKNIWYLLQQCRGVVIGDKYNPQSRIDRDLTLESTPGEKSFAIIIDKLFQNISAPEYAQLNIEALESLAQIFKHNKLLQIDDDLILDVLIGYAVRISWTNKYGEAHNYDEKKAEAWSDFYTLSPAQTNMAFTQAFIHLLDLEEKV